MPPSGWTIQVSIKSGPGQQATRGGPAGWCAWMPLTLFSPVHCPACQPPSRSSGLAPLPQCGASSFLLCPSDSWQLSPNAAMIRLSREVRLKPRSHFPFLSVAVTYLASPQCDTKYDQSLGQGLFLLLFSPCSFCYPYQADCFYFLKFNLPRWAHCKDTLGVGYPGIV